MLEHPLLAAFVKLVADFFGVPENDPELLKVILRYCAQALLQGQDPAAMRDTFEFERIQHFTTQYLDKEGRDALSTLLEETEQGLTPGVKEFQIFLREMPNRATWLRSSIPNWATSAELAETIGPIVNRDGRRFWVDIYKTVVDRQRPVLMDGSNRPVLFLAPDAGLTTRVVGGIGGRPVIGAEMAEGVIWVQAKLFSAEATEDLYCGLRVAQVSMTFPGVHPNNLRIVPNPINPSIVSTLTVRLAPAAPAAGETAYGADARDASVVLPDGFVLKFSPSSRSLDQVSGSGIWQIYGDQKKFEWTGGAPSYNYTFDSVAIPMALDADEFAFAGVQSPVAGWEGKAKVASGAWLLPAAKLVTPLLAEGAGMLMAEADLGLSVRFPGLLDANHIAPALLQPQKSLLTAAPGLIQIMAIQTLTEYATQAFQLWKGADERWIELRMEYPLRLPFVYQSRGSSTEVLVTVGHCNANLNRPVAANGQPLAFQTKNSLFLRSYSALHDDVLIYDENILRDNLPAAVAGAAPLFQSQAIALNNALMTTSPLNAFLLSGQLPPQTGTFEVASLSLAYGLLGYLPTLPDPYAANTGVFKWMVEQRQGNNGAYALDQIGHLLIGAMHWKSGEIPPVRFIFGDLESRAGNLPISTNLLQNLDLATNRSYEQYAERSRKAAGLIQRRTGQEINGWEHEYNLHIRVNDSYRNRHFFSLLDVSTAADWMGVNLGLLDERLLFERTFEILPEQNPLSADGMDVVAAGRFVRLFTVPQISWEPLINITPVTNAANDPPAGVLLFKDDGPPTLIGNTGAESVPIAPLPVAHYLEKNYRKNEDFKAWSFFTLPFGMLGMARYNQKGDAANHQASGASIELIQHQFGGGVTTGLQISTIGYLHDIQENRNFEGITEQLSNLYGADGSSLNLSVLSRTVTDIFNGEFGTNGANGRLRPRGVPVERYDFSGYGANVFSHWLNKEGKIGQTSQAKFDIWRGRTAHEVIQVRSIVYPWGIRVVRTVTMFRESTGLVYRVDSGWRAESDGIYDFKTDLVVGKNPDGSDMLVNETPGYEFHSGAVKGVFTVRNIVESEDISPFVKTWNKTYGYYIETNGAPTSVGGGKQLPVNLVAVYFDADVEIENVVQGAVNGRVPSKRMIGFLQIAPQGVPISPEDFAQLLQENKGLGGSVDCLVNIAQSNQTMRVNRVEIQPSRTAANKLVFVTAANGTPVLPKDGSWSVVMHKKSTGEVLPISSSGVPLIRRGIHGTPTNEPFELAQAAHLFNLNLEDRATQFAFLQNTDTQKVLFRNPHFEQGNTRLKSSDPDLADAYRLLDSKGIFPKVGTVPRIEFQAKNFGLDIIEQGYKLAHAIDGEKMLEQKLPEGPVYFINEKDVKIYVEYAKKDILGNTKKAGFLNFDLNSSAQKWLNKLEGVTMVIDLLDMKRLFLIRGKFDTEKGKAPSFIEPELEFGEDLQPVYDILQILMLLNGGNYAEALTKGLKIAMSNSPNTWEYKFQADKEIPALRFPPPAADSPVAPLRLECYLKLGCYFNVGMPLPPGEGVPMPSGGGYVEFGAKLSVMCVSVAAATVYAVGTCVLRIGADTVRGPSLYMKMGFGIELMVGLPVIGNVSVYYGAGVEIYIDTREITAGAFILFRGRAELIGGLVTIQIQIEAGGKISRTGDETYCIAQVTFSLDISIFLIINISFTERFEERRQIA